METIEFKYLIKEKDLLRFNFWLKYKKSYVFPLYFIFFIVLFICAFLLYLQGAFSQPILYFFFSPIILFYVFIPLLTIYRVQSLFHTSSIMKKEIKLTFNEQEICQSTDTSHLQLQWDQILYAGESKGAIYLFVSRNQALLIPYDIMEKEQLHDLKQLILSKLPVKKVKWLRK